MISLLSSNMVISINSLFVKIKRGLSIISTLAKTIENDLSILTIVRFLVNAVCEYARWIRFIDKTRNGVIAISKSKHILLPEGKLST